MNTGAPASKSAASSASDTAASEEAASKAAKAEAKRLKKLAKQAKATARLLRLMGTPVSTLHQNSCLVDGATDWLYTFEHVTIQTLKTSDAETLYAVSKAG